MDFDIQRYLQFIKRREKKHDEIISFLTKRDEYLVHDNTRFYIGMYNNIPLWMNMTVIDDDDTCFETVLFEGTDKVAKDIVYYPELGYNDVCRFVSPTEKSFDETHFEELYKEIVRLRNEINILST
jgi:hypothetical protein